MVNVILIGFMGSGKSTFGKWLSDKQQMDFVDTDEYIEGLEGKSVSEIFATKGEAYFRELETETIKDFLGMNGRDKALVRSSVISVGGGLVVREINQELVKRLGKVVFLDASVEELVRRLENDNTRPLLKGGNLKEKISALMDARIDIYDDVSDIIINTDGKTMNEIYQELLKEW